MNISTSAFGREGLRKGESIKAKGESEEGISRKMCKL
jgi:hypothetical protein